MTSWDSYWAAEIQLEVFDSCFVLRLSHQDLVVGWSSYSVLMNKVMTKSQKFRAQSCVWMSENTKLRSGTLRCYTDYSLDWNKQLPSCHKIHPQLQWIGVTFNELKMFSVSFYMLVKKRKNQSDKIANQYWRCIKSSSKTVVPQICCTLNHLIHLKGNAGSHLWLLWSNIVGCCLSVRILMCKKGWESCSGIFLEIGMM